MRIRRTKTLVLDIEISPLVVYVWGIHDQNVSLAQIKEDWKIMAWSAKWLGERTKPMYYDISKNPQGGDAAILKPLWKLLNEAEIVMTQNGTKFDAKKINARFMLHGMKPPKPYVHYDTYKLARNVAAFTSNTLEYLTDKFCKKNKKLRHKKYPGWSLWIQCLAGNKEAWREMRKYNIGDVLSTEELYTKIKAWAPQSMPKIFRLTDAAKECGTCEYEGPMVEGKERRTKKKAYRQHSCPKCGAWQPGEEIKR